MHPIESALAVVVLWLYSSVRVGNLLCAPSLLLRGHSGVLIRCVHTGRAVQESGFCTSCGVMCVTYWEAVSYPVVTSSGFHCKAALSLSSHLPTQLLVTPSTTAREICIASIERKLLAAVSILVLSFMLTDFFSFKHACFRGSLKIIRLLVSLFF